MKPAKITLRNGRDRATARKWVDAAPPGYTLLFKPPVRTNVASAYMWALLDDVAAQKDWPLGSGKRWPSDAWKDLFSAALRGQEMVPNLEGNGFVAFGSRTSEFGPEEMSDMIELIKAWGAQNDVKFTDQESLGVTANSVEGERREPAGAGGQAAGSRGISEAAK